MRAVRNTERGVEVVDAPDPTGRGVDVRVRSAGICGSDLHMIGFGPSPMTLGHEFAGMLDDGSPVAVDPTTPCGTCDQCTSGARHLCRTGADRVVAVHGLRVAELTGGERVAVVGAGAIGLAAVAALQPVAGTVGLVARHDSQRAAGERLGATEASGEYDVVVEAAGTETALERACELCTPGGSVLFLSTHWTPVPIPGLPALMKELTFRWSYTYGAHGASRDLDAAAELLATNPEIAATLITHRFPLADAAEAFRVAADRAAGAIKVVIEP